MDSAAAERRRSGATDQDPAQASQRRLPRGRLLRPDTPLCPDRCDAGGIGVAADAGGDHRRLERAGRRHDRRPGRAVPAAGVVRAGPPVAPTRCRPRMGRCAGPGSRAKVQTRPSPVRPERPAQQRRSNSVPPGAGRPGRARPDLEARPTPAGRSGPGQLACHDARQCGARPSHHHRPDWSRHQQCESASHRPVAPADRHHERPTASAGRPSDRTARQHRPIEYRRRDARCGSSFVPLSATGPLTGPKPPGEQPWPSTRRTSAPPEPRTEPTTAAGSRPSRAQTTPRAPTGPTAAATAPNAITAPTTPAPTTATPGPTGTTAAATAPPLTLGLAGTGRMPHPDTGVEAPPEHVPVPGVDRPGVRTGRRSGGGGCARSRRRSRRRRWGRRPRR